MNESTGRQRKRDPDNLIGKIVAGQFRVKRCIGAGGMGVIYVAHQDRLDRDIVLKITKSAAVEEDPGALARFQREAKSLSKVTHPNVVAIYDYGVDKDLKLSYIAMEYIKGHTLSHVLKRRKKPFSPGSARTIIEQLLSGVAEAHRHGLIHRDLKLSNIMLSQTDTGLRVTVLDFGLTKHHTKAEPLTQVNQFVGSPLYIAPEVMSNGKVDARADVYALGVVLYQLLSKAKPYQGENGYGIMMAQLSGKFTPLVEVLPENHNVGGELIQLIESCLATEPSHRPDDAGALLMAISSLLDLSDSAISLGPGVTMPPVTSRPAPSRQHPEELPTLSATHTTRSHVVTAAGWMGAAVALMALFLVMVLLGGILYELRRSDVQTQELAAAQLVVPATAPTDPVAEVLRKSALNAIKEGNYDSAVALLTDAMIAAPDRTDLSQLLQIATEMRDKRVAAPEVAVVEAAPQPTAAPRPTRSARPAPRRAPSPKPSPKAPALVNVVVTLSPQGSEFEVAGQRYTSPSNVELSPGSYPIEYFVDGKSVHRGDLDVAAGEGVIVTDLDLSPYVITKTPEPVEPPPELVAAMTARTAPTPAPQPEPEPEPSQAFGEVHVESPNVVGDVWVNGTKRGPAPMVVKKLPVGPVEIEVRVGKHVRATKTITIVEDTRVHVVL